MLAKAIIAVAAGYAALAGLAYVLQDRMIFIPRKTLEATPAAAGLVYEDVALKARDGVRLHAWLVKAPEERGALVLCHGNAGNISHRLDSLRLFADMGLSALIFDYRGYGNSEGKPSEAGMYADALAAWEHLTEVRHYPPKKIVLFGRSLGGAVAAELALHTRPAGLIIESSFTSYTDIGRHHYPWLPVGLLARYRFDTMEKVMRIACPKLFIHSPDDDIVPYRQGRRLYEDARAPKAFLEIGGDHNSGFLSSGGLYTEGLQRFVDTVLP